MTDRGSITNPGVNLRDAIRREALRMAQGVDQVLLGQVSDVGDGVAVGILLDGFAGGEIPATWANTTVPEVGQRVVLGSLKNGGSFFVVGVLGGVDSGRAQLYVSSSAETTIGTAGTFVKAAGTTTLTTAPAAKGWSMPTNNRLRYDGVADRLAVVHCPLSLQAAGTAVDLSIRLAKNGTTIADTEITLRVASASQDGAVSTVGLVEVSNGDYIELWVANETDTTNLTVTKMTLALSDKAI